MNSHDIDALRALADHFADVGEIHFAAAKSAHDPQTSDRFRREGERLAAIGQALLNEVAPESADDEEEPESFFQIIDKLRLAVDDWLTQVTMRNAKPCAKAKAVSPR